MFIRYFLIAFLFFQIIFIKIISFFPKAVDRFYSTTLYIDISIFLRQFWGKISFSVGDFLYAITIFYGIYSIFKFKKTLWKKHLLLTINFISVAYFCFNLFWGFNYYRTPLFDKLSLKTDYSTADLYFFADILIKKTNEVQFKITNDITKKVVVPYSDAQFFELSNNGYTVLSKEYSFFAYKYVSKKQSLFSTPLLYMGFTGYLNPFTGEANINTKVPRISIANTVCHEMAHQIGYGSESECNFIGFLACIKNDNLYFQYSALQNALQYTMALIELKDKKIFYFFKTKINRGILKNYADERFFWQSHNTIINSGFHTFYDQFLRLNKQKDGIASYSKYVDLLINYYKKRSL